MKSKFGKIIFLILISAIFFNRHALSIEAFYFQGEPLRRRLVRQALAINAGKGKLNVQPKRVIIHPSDKPVVAVTLEAFKKSMFNAVSASKIPIIISTPEVVEVKASWPARDNEAHELRQKYFSKFMNGSSDQMNNALQEMHQQQESSEELDQAIDQMRISAQDTEELDNAIAEMRENE